MQLHNNSGNITVIIDVSFDDRDMFTDFILNEQCHLFHQPQDLHVYVSIFV